MAILKQAISVRVNPVLYEKFKVVAEQSSRPIAKQLEFLMRQCVEQYEREKGEITDLVNNPKIIKNNNHGINNYTENNYSTVDNK